MKLKSKRIGILILLGVILLLLVIIMLVRHNLTSVNSLVIRKPANIKDVVNLSCDSIKTLGDLEDILGIDLVFEGVDDKEVGLCDIKLDDNGKVESVEVSVLGFDLFTDYNSKIDQNYKDNLTSVDYLQRNQDLKILDLQISFMGENASDEVKEYFANISTINAEDISRAKNFKANNLGVRVFYYPVPSERIMLSKYFMFKQDNVLYTFVANSKTTMDEVIEIIKKL